VKRDAGSFFAALALTSPGLAQAAGLGVVFGGIGAGLCSDCTAEAIRAAGTDFVLGG
jgi:hypothetical protein